MLQYIMLSGALLIGSLLSAQEVKSISKSISYFEANVSGVCGNCQDRIEHAASISGVKSAKWNKETDLLRVYFSAKKTTPNDILTSVSMAGHRSEYVAEDTAAYAKLPMCCQYDSQEKH